MIHEGTTREIIVFRLWYATSCSDSELDRSFFEYAPLTVFRLCSAYCRDPVPWQLSIMFPPPYRAGVGARGAHMMSRGLRSSQ